MLAKKDPLFILSPPRSYTSVTCAMIGQHPEMYGLPEVNLFARENYGQLLALMNAFRPRLGHGLWRAFAQLGIGEQTQDNIEIVKKCLEEDTTVTTSALFSHLVHWAAPRVLVDKSPLYVFRPAFLERIREAFPEARYLHLVRHPFGTCESVNRKAKEVQELEGLQPQKGSFQFISSSKVDPGNSWLNPHLRILAFLKTIPPERQMLLRGEDLLSDPDTHLREIAKWLGISTNEAAIEAMKHPERSPFACYGPMNARMGNDSSFLESPVLRPFTTKLKSLRNSSTEHIIFSNQLIELGEQFGYA
ncbi:MAG: sulfotransferase [Nitrososphaera sp.]|nr:sulfotransferase [Nitrososphaera sp.]